MHQTAGDFQDYSFEVNEEDNSIKLIQYKGYEEELTVYGTAVIGDKEYQVYAGEYCPWGDDITRLTCSDGFQFRKIDMGESYFYPMSSLQMLDLGNADFSQVFVYNKDSVIGVGESYELQSLILPSGAACPFRLYGAFADDKGNVFSRINVEPDHVTAYSRADIDGWLSFYSFTASGNRIVLKEYNNGVIPFWDNGAESAKKEYY